jgi:hypothetical protein
MTATRHAATEAPPARAIPLALARTHLRLGSLALARTELETLARLGTLDPAGLVDLAEVRWRTGDLPGAGEAASAVLRTDEEHPVALLIAAEAAMSAGRPNEARKLASRAMACATDSIDMLFAGMPRSAVWPPDADEPPPTAPTLFDRDPEPAPVGHADRSRPGIGEPTPGPAKSGAVPVAIGFWDDERAEEPQPEDLPDPALALEEGRVALVAGATDKAALRFAIALRLAPALAPAVLEATAGARAPSLVIVRGDAYRLAGHELEAREAYGVAARGGLPERRQRSRAESSKTPATTEDAAAAASPEASEGAAEGAGHDDSEVETQADSAIDASEGGSETYVGATAGAVMPGTNDAESTEADGPALVEGEAAEPADAEPAEPVDPPDGTRPEPPA